MSLRALFLRRPADPDTIEVVFEQEVYSVRLRRHPQARRYTLRILVSTREAVITIPRRGSLKGAKTFAEKNGGWIAARLGRLPASVPFADGVIVPFRGAPHRIVHRCGERGTVWTESDEQNNALLCVAGAAPHLARRFRDFLKREAKRDLEVACRNYAAKLGVNFKRVSVRDQSSRWGSCSTTGVLSFSWRLVLAPSYVLDYLAAHEVAHIVEMNHSRRFWRLVLGICPDAHRAKVWLVAHGAELYRYGLSRGERPVSETE